MAAELSDRQQRFVKAFVRTGNPVESYKAAGYNVKSDAVAASNASRLLKDAKICEAVARLRQPPEIMADVSAARTLRELARIGFSDARRLFNPDGTLKPVHEWDDDTAAAVSSVEVFEEYEGQGAARRLIGHTRKVKLWDKNTALEKVGKRLGMWREMTPLEVLLGALPAGLREQLGRYVLGRLDARATEDGVPPGTRLVEVPG